MKLDRPDIIPLTVGAPAISAAVSTSNNLGKTADGSSSATTTVTVESAKDATCKHENPFLQFLSGTQYVVFCLFFFAMFKTAVQMNFSRCSMWCHAVIFLTSLRSFFLVFVYCKNCCLSLLSFVVAMASPVAGFSTFSTVSHPGGFTLGSATSTSVSCKGWVCV